MCQVYCTFLFSGAAQCILFYNLLLVYRTVFIVTVLGHCTGRTSVLNTVGGAVSIPDSGGKYLCFGSYWYPRGGGGSVWYEGIVNTTVGKIVSVAFFPKAVYICILSGFTVLTVHVVPKVSGHVVCVSGRV